MSGVDDMLGCVFVFGVAGRAVWVPVDDACAALVASIVLGVMRSLMPLPGVALGASVPLLLLALDDVLAVVELAPPIGNVRLDSKKKMPITAASVVTTRKVLTVARDQPRRCERDGAA